MGFFNLNLEYDLDIIDNILSKKNIINDQWCRNTETLLNKHLNDNFALTASYDTSIRIAIDALGIDSNSVIITSPYACIATFIPFKKQKAEFIFCDIDIRSGIISAESLKIKLEKYSKRITHALIPFQCGFVPEDLDEIINVLKTYEIPIIFDLMEAFGSKFKNKPLCSYADLSIFSFESIRNPSGIWLGGLSTRNKELFENIIQLRDLGLPTENRLNNRKILLGISGRPNELFAYILFKSIQGFNEVLEQRSKTYSKIIESLNEIRGVKIISQPIKFSEANNWLIGILIDNHSKINDLKKLGFQPEKIHKDIRFYEPFRDAQILKNCDTFSKNFYCLSINKCPQYFET